MVDVYLGLGSNLGDRAANLWEAVRRIGLLPDTVVAHISPLYETAPVGPVDQGLFLNAVGVLRTNLAASVLLDTLKAIERALGRADGVRWGPRVIDIDILLYGDVSIETPVLAVPHREMWNRAFVLAPLLDVLPQGELAERVRARLEALVPGSETLRRHETGAG